MPAHHQHGPLQAGEAGDRGQRQGDGHGQPREARQGRRQADDLLQPEPQERGGHEDRQGARGGRQASNVGCLDHDRRQARRKRPGNRLDYGTTLAREVRRNAGPDDAGMIQCGNHGIGILSGHVQED